TPDQYREKWGLPRDYPMVAPSYSELRSRMAKQLGLGGRPPASPTPTQTTRRRRGAQNPQS
ncbi:MAG TPA: MucR family transcriptional regulator, partial [Caulobacteraceae bacterium]|nr:MucR family transcriptional regulator [Caulobacteraceae bacterium]